MPDDLTPYEDTAGGRTSRRSHLVPWAIVVALALVATWLGLQLFVSGTEKRLLAQREELSRTALSAAQAQLESEQIIARAVAAEYNRERAKPVLEQAVALLVPSAEGGAGPNGALAWISSQKQGVLVLEGLKPSSATDHYELWTSGAPALCVALFTTTADGRANIHFSPPESVGEGAKFVVSFESNERTKTTTSPTNVVLRTP